MTLRSWIFLLPTCFATAQPVAFLPDDLKPYQALLLATQRAQAGPQRKSSIEDLLAVENHTRAFLEYAAAQPAAQQGAAIATFGQIAKQLAQARIDQQEGSGPNASGSVSAVAHAGITSLLSLAVDSGSVTQAISGTAATVSGNLDSVTRVLLGREPFPYCAPGQAICGTPFLKDLAFSVSLDLSRGGSKSVWVPSSTGASMSGSQNLDLLTAGRQLSGATVKYVFANPQDIRSKAFQKQWTDYYNTNRTQFQKAGASLLQALGPAVDPVLESTTYGALQLSYGQKLLDNLDAGRDIVPLFREYLDAVTALARSLSPDFDDKVRSAVQGYMQYFANVRPLIAAVVSKPVFSAEYDYQRPASQPDMHHLCVLSTLNPFGPSGSMSINLAATSYVNGTDARNYGRWRDVQASLQLERRLGDIVNHPATFSLAAYYQYMLTPGLLKVRPGNLAPGTSIDLGQSATVALAPKGSIWIAEAKITLKVKDSGAEIPLSITRSNRTDLINAPEVRGHVGLTFDFGKLFASK